MYGFSNAVLATGLLLVFGCYVIFRSYLKLRHIPGPFWARLTNIQRILWVRSGRAHVLHQHVHQQFGDVVRFGPNMVSVSDPAAIATIYPTRTGIPKVNRLIRAIEWEVKWSTLQRLMSLLDIG